MGWMSKYEIPEFLALEMNKARVGTKDREFRTTQCYFLGFMSQM